VKSLAGTLADNPALASQSGVAFRYSKAGIEMLTRVLAAEQQAG
jgi:hypothetical protein